MPSIDCPHENSYKYMRLVRKDTAFIWDAFEKLVHEAIGLALDKLDYHKTSYDTFYLLFCPACKMLQMNFFVAGGAPLGAIKCRHKQPYSFSTYPAPEVLSRIKKGLSSLFAQFNVEKYELFWKMYYNLFAILYCEPDKLLQVYLLYREPQEVSADMQHAIAEARLKKEWSGLFER